MVNVIQRLAAVVVKKSLQEGFGLGVNGGCTRGSSPHRSTPMPRAPGWVPVTVRW
jgi:hypothetical protein